MDGNSHLPETYDVVIVGTGISGIAMAAYLARKCPEKTYLIVDRRDRLGGTWDLFRYPGVRSDSDMYTLGYSFEPWRDGKSIADGETIRSYLERVADRFGILGNIRFGEMALSADWNSSAGLWTLTTQGSDGAQGKVRGRFLFFGSGYYDYDAPHDAQIPGLDRFEGEVLHPQFWPDDFNHLGKKVVVIGSGATAATIVPAMATKAEHVTMLQRTPSWYYSTPGRDFLANTLRRIMPARVAYSLTRAKNLFLQGQFVSRSRRKPEQVKDFLTDQAKKHLKDKFDAEAFTPPYNPWDQRVCLIPDGDLFEAIRSDRASIVTGRIEAVDATGLVLEDGRHFDADVIVTATGLKLAALGKVAVSLDGEPVDFPDHYYYRNCMFSNVPNLAAVFGYLNAAWTLRAEMVADWVCRLLQAMDDRGAAVATPYLPDDHNLEEDDIFWGFSSGYLHRGRHLIPMSATTQPWRLGQDHVADRKAMGSPIEDGILRLESRSEFAAAQ